MVEQALESINPAGQRHLSLRGYKIPALENLGVTKDAFECIDLSDNDVLKITPLPPLRRLQTLILCNNRVQRIAADAFDAVPNLTSLILTNNQIDLLVDLKPILEHKTLERVSLVDNPVCRKIHYRNYVIFKAGESLRVLDFTRVKKKERETVAGLFTGTKGTELLDKIAPPRLEKEEKVVLEKTGLTAKEIERVKQAIADATTIEEVTELEKALKTGILPDSLVEREMEVDEEGEAQ